MVNFRACPRCKGDVHVKQDVYGKYRECLQCGYMVDLLPRHNIRDLAVDVKRNSRKSREAA